MTFIVEPTQCPCCNYPLEKVNDQLFCRNISCTAQINGKLLHFCKVLGIKGMGPKTIEKLCLTDIIEIFYLDKVEVDKLIGEKVSAKLLDEINRAKTVPLSTIIEAFSIPLVGNVISKKIASVVSNIDEITEEKCKKAGLGEKATANLLDWVNGEYQAIKEFLPFTIQTVVQDNTRKTVCITGKLKSYKKKADAEQHLLEAGYTLVDSVTKTTCYLVDEENGTSTKRQKADKYGITIITDLNDLLKDNIK